MDAKWVKRKFGSLMPGQKFKFDPLWQRPDVWLYKVSAEMGASKDLMNKIEVHINADEEIFVLDRNK